MGDVQVMEWTSFVSGLYDTGESKPSMIMKRGDASWKPRSDRKDGDSLLSATEAKQLWFESEIQSLKTALNRVSVPPVFQPSGYWNVSFAGKSGTPACDPFATVACCEAGVSVQSGGSGVTALQDRALHGGSGEVSLRDRAGIGAPAVPDGVRAAYLSGEHRDRSRVFAQRGEFFQLIGPLRSMMKYIMKLGHRAWCSPWRRPGLCAAR